MIGGPTMKFSQMEYQRPNVDEMIEQYKLRRNYIVNGFNRIGLPTHLPHGAFYIL